MRAHALFHVAPRIVECREIDLPTPARGEVLIKTRYSAISAGTESMIFNGDFPKDMTLDDSIASLRGNFVYPFRYGYALVGEVLATGPGVDESLIGKTLFAFHPHQDLALVSLKDCHRVPDAVSPEAALFLPQVETALSLVMDGAPLIGERVLVSGLGVVGLLTARLLADFPLARLVAAEPVPWRRDTAATYGIAQTVDPENAAAWQTLLSDMQGADLIFEVSGNMSALRQAIDAAGFDARIVLGSWYGSQSRPLDLGGRFHRNRLRLISSQVSTLNPALTGRWNKARRIDMAWRLVEKLEPGRLIGPSFPLPQCQQAFETVCERPAGMMQMILKY